jgi:Fe-S cluster assembly iron-binding protein IscA
MLTVTEAAAGVIAELSARAGGPGECGLRVASTTDFPDKLAVSVARVPAAGDHVVAADGGARVFLDPNARELLDDKVLDVRAGSGDEVDFVIVART